MYRYSKIKWLKVVLITVTTAFSSAAMTSGGGDSGGSDNSGFGGLLERSGSDGKCSVTLETVGDSTLYIPVDGSDSAARFNVMVWGNGTGGTVESYKVMLTSVASQCIAIAAANTGKSGSGLEMQAALNSMREHYSHILQPNHKVCTAGHSQGGGGSFNAANLVAADCVIAVQPDTNTTVQINAPLAESVEVITLWGQDDLLAPARRNRGNVDANSSILTQVETSGEDHYAPTNNRGGVIGSMFRMANIAQLSNDSTLMTEFRGAFWGETTDNTVSASHSKVSDVRRDEGAIAATP